MSFELRGFTIKDILVQSKDKQALQLSSWKIELCTFFPLTVGGPPRDGKFCSFTGPGPAIGGA